MLTRVQRWLLIVLIAAFGIVSGALNSNAMGMCGAYADFVKALNDKYQEVKSGAGLAGNTALVELFKSKAGTWTVLATTPDGKTCIIAAGKGWVESPAEILGEDS